MDTKKEIKSVECRFVIHAFSSTTYDDAHFVKEHITFTDGTSEPNFRFIPKFKRPYWITKKGCRNHTQKKEYESIDKLIKYESTQRGLSFSIAKSLETPWVDKGLRKVCRSPYVYGADIGSTAIIKKMYQTKYPDANSFYSVAVYDTETDMVNGTEEIIMATLSYKDKVLTVINKSFLTGYADVENRLQKLLIKYLGKYVEDRKIKWEIKLVDREADVVVECFVRAHSLKPDFVAIWNMNFDIPKSIKALEKANIDPKNVFSDPSVPDQYKNFEYKKGIVKKVAASGKESSKAEYDQWHTVFCPSSFYLIDAMCVYYQIRSQNTKEQSYGLSAILEKHLGVRKLNFKEAEHIDKAEWHQFMQSKYPLEYVIYNVFDCVGMEVLDESISDLSLTLPMFSGCSDFKDFASQPKKLADNFHYHCLNNGYVYGTTSDEMVSELDSKVLSLSGWVTTLPADLITNNGLKIVKEDPALNTSLYMMVGDLDVSASYPNGEICFNISRGTTHKELCQIQGISEELQRRQGINLSGGATNAVEICTNLFKLPTFDILLESFEKNI